MHNGSRLGFTLIELLVALMVGAIVILGARALLDGLTSHAEKVLVLARRTDVEANAERVLREAVARTGIASDSTALFDGTPEGATFRSWCDTPAGWQEPCKVRLMAEGGSGTSDRTRVVVRLAGAGNVVVMSHVHSATFQYLASARDGGRWVTRWEQAISPPLAIGLITRAAPTTSPDTMILRVGEHD